MLSCTRMNPILVNPVNHILNVEEVVKEPHVSCLFHTQETP